MCARIRMRGSVVLLLRDAPPPAGLLHADEKQDRDRPDGTARRTHHGRGDRPVRTKSCLERTSLPGSTTRPTRTRRTAGTTCCAGWAANPSSSTRYRPPHRTATSSSTWTPADSMNRRADTKSNTNATGKRWSPIRSDKERPTGSTPSPTTIRTNSSNRSSDKTVPPRSSGRETSSTSPCSTTNGSA